MNRLCLDTSAYSQFERGHRETLRIVDEAREVIIPVVALGELRIGFRLGGREEANERRLREFLERPSVRVVAVDEEVADLYADLNVEIRRSGKMINANDLWIAAVALQEGATVLTFDEHFTMLSRVRSILLKP